MTVFSAASGRGLIEAVRDPAQGGQVRRFSAASGRGLIEARQTPACACPVAVRFPRHRAAASLKLGQGVVYWRVCRRFPRHRAAASLKRRDLVSLQQPVGRFPRHRAAASLKRLRAQRRRRCSTGRFPRHRAAASLKPVQGFRRHERRAKFSAASGRGLIEARDTWRSSGCQSVVFRGIGPRPH